MAERDLNAPVSRTRTGGVARRMGVAGFWRWWLAELQTLVPGGARDAMARRRMRPALMFEGERASLYVPATVDGRSFMQAASTISLAGDSAAVVSAGRAMLAPFAGATHAGTGGVPRIVVALAPRDVLRKTLHLPAAVAENLQQALAYDLDRHTPFKPEELYFDAAIVGHDRVKNELLVDLATVRRSVVDVARRHVQSWGGEIAAVVPDAPDSAASSRLNLLPHDARSVRPFWSKWEFWLPLALLAALTLAAVIIPLWQKRDYVIALAEVAERARAQAAVSETLRQDLDTRVGDYNFVLGRKYAFPSPAVQIDEAARLLPDDTWLTQLDLKAGSKAKDGKEVQREILIRGETANAGRLVPIFEESKVFMQAAPRSPTTKIQPGPGEIFDLGALVRPLPAPAPIPLLSVADAAKPEAGAVPTGTTSAAPANAASSGLPSQLPAGSAAVGGTPVPAPTGSTPAVTPGPTPSAAGPAPGSPATTPVPARTAAPAPSAGPKS